MDLFTSTGEKVGNINDIFITALVALDRDRLLKENENLRIQLDAEKDEKEINELRLKVKRLERTLGEVFSEVQRLNESGEFTQLMRRIKEGMKP